MAPGEGVQTPSVKPHGDPGFSPVSQGSEKDYELWVHSDMEAAPYPLAGECQGIQDGTG